MFDNIRVMRMLLFFWKETRSRVSGPSERGLRARKRKLLSAIHSVARGPLKHLTRVITVGREGGGAHSGTPCNWGRNRGEKVNHRRFAYIHRRGMIHSLFGAHDVYAREEMGPVTRAWRGWHLSRLHKSCECRFFTDIISIARKSNNYFNVSLVITFIKITLYYESSLSFFVSFYI